MVQPYGMEAAIRFSPTSLPGTDQRFLYVNVTGKSFQLCRITEQIQQSIKYDTVHLFTKVPAFRAFDWHPINQDLVVVGQAGGEATLLNIASGQQDSVSFQVRSQRLCNAVALSSQNLLAAGLDKVRTDFCLNIWDFNQRLPAAGSVGFSKGYSEPLHKLASGEPITSLKFFQDNPQLLVAGVKGQFVRLYDLREPSAGNGLQFSTRCVHNLAIDWLDENYFASCYPTNDPSICLWDRRMNSRSNTAHIGFNSASHSENRQPEPSLELKNAIDSPGTIWSLRFSRAERGRLGVLSSTGHFRVYSIGKDFMTESYDVEGNTIYEHDPRWEIALPQDVYLDRVQDVEKHYAHPSARRDEKARVVSFDFMTTRTRSKQCKMITLSGNGQIKSTSTSPPPEPSSFSSTGLFCKGHICLSESAAKDREVGEALEQVRRRAEPRNALKQSIKQSKQNKSGGQDGGRRMSSLANHAWYADLGFYERDVPIQDFLALTSIQRLRCQAGYLFTPSKNKRIVSDTPWLQSFWAWIERASRISRHGNMTQDNLDLSYVGVFGLWMEEINPKNRTLGPGSNRITKIIESLVQRLNLPAIKGCATEYPAHRQICLHVSGLAWSYEELEALVKGLAAQNLHTKAAAMAIFAGERKLAYRALRSRSANQSHKMLAMAIAGAAQRGRKDEAGTTTGDDSDAQDDDWSDTISSLAEELTDPYARAILAYVKSGDWSNVITEDSLPLKYRVCVALRHLDDSKLTRYISQATKDAIAEGDIEGVVLTGTATKEAFDLMSSYASRFGDLQTAVLALCGGIPKYVDDEKIVRKFDAWKATYRAMMNSWALRFDRVRFDIACQKAAVDSSGRRLIEPAKQQVRLVCGFCAQSLAHSDRTTSIGNSDHEVPASQGPKTMVETAKNPLTSEKAAAIGTVCPKCGRHLPRCGVCDMWLGMPDETYLRWYGHQQGSNKKSVDLSASLTGSVQTTIGPGQQQFAKGTDSPRFRPPLLGQSKSATPTNGTVVSRDHSDTERRKEAGEGEEDQDVADDDHDDAVTKQKKHDREWDEKMARFTVYCVKCSHGCHASHARMWFTKHSVCPVPTCQCICNE